jgi:hypothetical protein
MLEIKFKQLLRCHIVAEEWLVENLNLNFIGSIFKQIQNFN